MKTLILLILFCESFWPTGDAKPDLPKKPPVVSHPTCAELIAEIEQFNVREIYVVRNGQRKYLPLNEATAEQLSFTLGWLRVNNTERTIVSKPVEKVVSTDTVKKKLIQSKSQNSIGTSSTTALREEVKQGVGFGPYDPFANPVYEEKYWFPGQYKWQGKNLRLHVLEEPHTTMTAQKVSWMSGRELVMWHTADHRAMLQSQQSQNIIVSRQRRGFFRRR